MHFKMYLNVCIYVNTYIYMCTHPRLVLEGGVENVTDLVQHLERRLPRCLREVCVHEQLAHLFQFGV